MTLSVHSLFMDMTASLCVTAILHTVIMSTAVYSLQEVRSVINIPSVTYEIFERFGLILCYTVLWFKFKMKRFLRKKYSSSLYSTNPFSRYLVMIINRCWGSFWDRWETIVGSLKRCIFSRISDLFYNTLQWQECHNRSHQKSHQYRQ